ncbi:hypothetical protein ASPWEDRAFT_280773 [Aspergillus wentii DTO 134E9]|uniref:Uncharacterized protein n=1 Tax=Aspergillus wentii DTO 134E9 TaxID=1073089 RepID=A0A1L9S3C8_ASPWE|nr:uncharacterized protein ASPWEDRAFT_280773 [Aspergillus wentii DTO 134E9]OJJ41656.1 hypothetical protein ASPWEDRAFT_280773 [Aspergillus wentii DTO 134E9]
MEKGMTLMMVDYFSIIGVEQPLKAMGMDDSPMAGAFSMLFFPCDECFLLSTDTGFTTIINHNNNISPSILLLLLLQSYYHLKFGGYRIGRRVRTKIEILTAAQQDLNELAFLYRVFIPEGFDKPFFPSSLLFSFLFSLSFAHELMHHESTTH